MAGQNRSGSRKQSGKVAFCGMMVALSVALMLTGGLVPIATYCAPMLGGILLLPIMLEYGRKTAWTAYIATSLIVLTLGVDKEAAFFYLFLGYYPIIKWNIEKIGKKPLRLALKLVVFNAAIFLMYAILGFVLHMDAVVAEFTEMGAWLLFLFAVLMATLFLPQVVLNIPQFLMYRQFGWVDSPYYLALIVPTLFAQETYFVYMLIQFMRNIPRELDEAAKIDGCNIMQTLVLVPFMRGWFNYRLIVDFRDRRFRHLLALSGPAVLSMAVSELNHMVDQWRASYGNPGDVSALSYGYKVITLLTGVVIVPLTTIMFSRMSRMVAENDRRGILGIVRRSTVTIAMVMTPIIAICAVGNQDVIKALYLGGQFDLESAAVTAGVFLFYVIGVLGFGLRDLLNRTFHAMQDTRTTMYVSAGIVVANVILNSIFHALMGVRGLALATTVSGTGGMLVLFYLLRRRMRRLGMKRIVPDMAKIFLASGLTALVAWGVGSLMPVAENRMFAILRMLAMGGAGLGVYLLIALALGVTPLKEFIGRKGNANDGRRTADHHGVPRGGRTGGRVAAPADADRVLRTGKTEKKPERVHAGRHRPPRAAGSSAAVRSARAGQDDAGRHHRRGDGAQHTHHQRPRH